MHAAEGSKQNRLAPGADIPVLESDGDELIDVLTASILPTFKVRSEPCFWDQLQQQATKETEGSAMAILGRQLDSPEMESTPVRDFLLGLKWGNPDL